MRLHVLRALRFLCVLPLLLPCLIAYAASSKIDPAKLGSPHSVVIQAFPPMKLWALIGAGVGPLYTEKGDFLFAPPSAEDVERLRQSANPVHVNVVPGLVNGKPASVQQAMPGMVAGTLFGALIEAGAEKTQRRAMGFENQVLSLFPTLDLRGELLQRLQAELQARGLAVSVEEEGLAKLPPRLRWPAQDSEGQPLPTLELDSSPAVDADLLVQLSPVAIYRAPGPLNSYRRMAVVDVAVYEGRSKRFIGRQQISFRGRDQGGFDYYKYDSLLVELPAAIPALRVALLSLVPDVADLISPPTQANAHAGQRAPLIPPLAPLPMAQPASAVGVAAAASAEAGATGASAATPLPLTVPFLGPKGQARFAAFQRLPLPRAFAISRNGYSASVFGLKPKDPSKPRDPSARALANCAEVAGQECMLFMVDHALVYAEPLPH